MDQMRDVNKNLHAEYMMLINRTEINEEDVEVILTPDGNQPTEAHFLIRLAVDFSKLPKKHIVVNDTAAVLHVTFRAPHWARSNAELHLSENLHEVFSNFNNIQLSSISLQKPLMVVVPEVKRMLNDKIDSILMAFEKKSAFISAVICHQSGSVIEYDSIDFNYVIILLEQCDFHFLVHFNLPQNFPDQPPRVTLQSVYFMSGKHEVYKHVIDGIPYSPRWEPAKMYSKAIGTIMTREVNRFKNNSTKHHR
uniref:BRISC and BRCA1-A complex member 2 n=1 Tax=Bracon brevicornis TaxID=1563983 RepID=A0A6V7IYY5_9HYME